MTAKSGSMIAHRQYTLKGICFPYIMLLIDPIQQETTVKHAARTWKWEMAIASTCLDVRSASNIEKGSVLCC